MKEITEETVKQYMEFLKFDNKYPSLQKNNTVDVDELNESELAFVSAAKSNTGFDYFIKKLESKLK